MKTIKIKIQEDKKEDRYIIKIYNGFRMIGLNFHQGVTDEGYNSDFICNDEKLFSIYINYSDRYHGEISGKKIIDKAIEAYLFTNING